MNLAAAILYQAMHAPAFPAIAAPFGLATYGDILSGALGCGRKLDEMNLRSGDIIAIETRDVRLHVALILAAELRGIATLSLHTVNDLIHAELTCTALFVDHDVTVEMPTPLVMADQSWLQAPPGADPVIEIARAEHDRDGMVRIFLSSGTTGRPKPVALTAEAVKNRMVQHGIQYGPLGPGDYVLPMMGISTVGGYQGLIHALLCGGGVALASTTRETVDMLYGFGVHGLIGSPAQVQTLIQNIGMTGVLPTLRRVVIGGSRVPQRLLLMSQSLLTHNTSVSYGATEAGLIARGTVSQLHGLEGAAGYVAPWTKVEIVDERGAQLGSEHEGIVRIKSYAMGTYIGNRAGEDSSMRDGWFYPGDIGTVRSDGLLMITGRTKEVIDIGGEKIAPEMVEEILVRHRAVSDAAVFGVPDASGIDRIWAAAVKSGKVEEAELIDYCRAQLPDRAPYRIVWVDAIPRTSIGKVQRDKLRTQVMERYPPF